ncbi:MAG TPA: hypothetical protein DEA05_14735 [Rhodobacteraceae bacterium]|nr:hypothetical protein [Paracoccaceae bacterium]
MPIKPIFLALALGGSLAACGQSTGEQALFGAGAGALGAAAVDANPVAGAAVGATANILYCEQNPGEC